MRLSLHTPRQQWLCGLFLSLICGMLMWCLKIQPVVQQINVLSQYNHHVSQKLRRLRKNGNTAFWSAPQLYRWLSVSQTRLGIHVVSVSAEREGIEVVVEGPLPKLRGLLQQWSESGIQSLTWQREHNQITLLLNAVRVQEISPATHQLIGEAGSTAQHYCVYQQGTAISMVKKGGSC